MRKLTIITLSLLLLVGCGKEKEEPKMIQELPREEPAVTQETDTFEEVTEAKDEIVEEVVEESEESSKHQESSDNVFQTKDFTITITDYKVIPVGEEGNEYGDSPVIAFWYDVTNNSDDTIDPSTTWIYHFEAIQDNDPNIINKLNISSLPDGSYRDTQLADIKPGGTLSNAVGYYLTDETTPILLQFKDNLFDDPVKEQTFNIQ